jgi:hypothetical protein
MEGPKRLLVDRLKSKGMEPSVIPAFLKTFRTVISAEPGIDPTRASQKMHSLGWKEVAIDYH